MNTRHTGQPAAHLMAYRRTIFWAVQYLSSRDTVITGMG